MRAAPHLTISGKETVIVIKIATTAFALACLAPITMQAQFPGNWKTDFSKHTVPLDEITSGGVPKDGIPAIDNPTFITVRAADRWLDDREPVVVVHLDDAVKAYPIQVLIWHEIVNDVVGKTPIAVTYCPLCNTALSFDRVASGSEDPLWVNQFPNAATR